MPEETGHSSVDASEEKPDAEEGSEAGVNGPSEITRRAREALRAMLGPPPTGKAEDSEDPPV